MIGDIPTTEKGEPILDKGVTVSEYQPPEEVVDFTQLVKKDYQIGYNIFHEPFEEFNDKTFYQRMNKDQKAFNSWMPDSSNEPDEAWRWQGVRPIVRQKILGIASHVIAAMVKPSIFAQNDRDEEDKNAEAVMDTLMQYNIRNSNYDLAFLFGVVGALFSPVSYFHPRYDEAFQTIKRKNKRGELERMNVKDSEMSGYNVEIVPPDQILITNPYQFYLQRQRAILRRKFVDYDDLQAKYGDHPNWKHVAPTKRILFGGGEEGKFYNIEDNNLAVTGEEVIYYNRREDLEIPFVNGAYLGDKDPKDNRITHRDNMNRPKYPYVKFGYHPVDAQQFYFYKSLAFELGPDYQLINEMHRLVMDRVFMEVMPPIGVMGTEERVDKSVRMPGAVSAFNEGTKVQPLVKGGNLPAGFKAMQSIEDSMTKSSQDELRSGVSTKGSRTAYEISRIEENARKQLGIFGTMVGTAVKNLGDLTVDLIINHQTVAETLELLAGKPKMEFSTFLLSDAVEKGKRITKKVVFDADLIGNKMTEAQIKKASYEIFKEEGGPDADIKIYRVNPYKFARLKFMCFVSPEKQWPLSRAFQKVINLEGYDRMIQNPFLDLKAVTRDYLVSNYEEKNPDRYMKKTEEDESKELEQVLLGQGSQKSNLVSNLTNKKVLEEATNLKK